MRASTPLSAPETKDFLCERNYLETDYGVTSPKQLIIVLGDGSLPKYVFEGARGRATRKNDTTEAGENPRASQKRMAVSTPLSAPKTKDRPYE